MRTDIKQALYIVRRGPRLFDEAAERRRLWRAGLPNYVFVWAVFWPMRLFHGSGPMRRREIEPYIRKEARQNIEERWRQAYHLVGYLRFDAEHDKWFFRNFAPDVPRRLRRLADDLEKVVREADPGRFDELREFEREWVRR